MRHDQRQRVFVLGADVDEMDIKAVDFGDEVRHGVKARLDLSPVVVGLPVLEHLLDGLQRDALGEVRDGLLVGQSSLRQAPAQVSEVRVRYVDQERTDGFGSLGGHWSSPEDLAGLRGCTFVLERTYAGGAENAR
jgi:hypothetical protein